MKRLLILILTFTFTTSCEELIFLDLETAKERLCIDANIKLNGEINELQVIKLSLTSGFYDQNINWVDDAVVEIIDLNSNTIHTFLHDVNQPGHYFSEFSPNFNINYKLRITHNGEIFESIEEELRPSSPIDNLIQGSETLFQGDEIEIIVSFTDDNSTDNYYIIDFGYNNFIATEDEFYQGNTFTFSYFYDELVPGDYANVTIYGADKTYFDFMSAVIEQTEDNGDPFRTSPSTVRGNIYNSSNSINYPLGYFNISETFSDSILIN